jgi:hypothetical protein
MIIVLMGGILIVYAATLPASSKPTAAASSPESWLDAVSVTLQQMMEEFTQEQQQLQQTFERTKQDMTQRVAGIEQEVTAKLYGIEHRWHTFSTHWERQRATSQEMEYTASQKRLTGSENLSTRTGELAVESGATTVDPIHVRTKFKALLEMHGQGKSVEYIAKKLGKNKGEVLLIIRLAQAEGTTDAAL